MCSCARYEPSRIPYKAACITMANIKNLPAVSYAINCFLSCGGVIGSIMVIKQGPKFHNNSTFSETIIEEQNYKDSFLVFLNCDSEGVMNMQTFITMKYTRSCI